MSNVSSTRKLRVAGDQGRVALAHDLVDGGAAGDVAGTLHAGGAEAQAGAHAGHLLVAGEGAPGVTAAALVHALATATKKETTERYSARVSVGSKNAVTPTFQPTLPCVRIDAKRVSLGDNTKRVLVCLFSVPAHELAAYTLHLKAETDTLCKAA